MATPEPKSHWTQRRLQDINSLLALNTPTRPWHIALIATIGMAIPAVIGVLLGDVSNAILACVGTMVILYIPRTSIPHRMVTLAVCSFGITACFTLGLFAGFNPYASALVLASTAILADFICRYYAIPAPGNFFFIFLTALGCTLPFSLDMIPTRAGLVALGGMLSCLIAFIYSLSATLPAPNAVAAVEKNIFRIVLESSVLGLFVGGSFLLAELLGLDKPYWVPISCAAIMQGANLQLVWYRKVHRIVGTAIGMGLAWCIFSLSLQGWSFALAVVLLFFIVELIIVRNYGLAVIFITPLTMLLAEGSASRILHESLVVTRMGDIVLGSAMGFVGGWVLHHPTILVYAQQKLGAVVKPNR